MANATSSYRREKPPSDDALIASIVGPDGRVLQNDIVVGAAASGGAWGAAAAKNGLTLIVWEEAPRGLYARTLQGSQLGPLTPIATTGAQTLQEQPAVAATVDGFVAVWRDGSLKAALFDTNGVLKDIRYLADGPIDGPPSLAATISGYEVAWVVWNGGMVFMGIQANNGNVAPPRFLWVDGPSGVYALSSIAMTAIGNDLIAEWISSDSRALVKRLDSPGAGTPLQTVFSRRHAVGH